MFLLHEQHLAQQASKEHRPEAQMSTRSFLSLKTNRRSELQLLGAFTSTFFHLSRLREFLSWHALSVHDFDTVAQQAKGVIVHADLRSRIETLLRRSLKQQ